MSVSTNDFKNGMTIELDGTLFQIIEFQHVKPGKGGAFVRTKLRNVKTGAVIERTFNAGVKVDQAIVERKDYQYLYPESDDFVFMDLQTYEQIHVPSRARRGGRELPGGGRRGAGGPARGRAHHRRSAGVDGADDHQDRPRREGRHAHGRAEAGHPGDRGVVSVPLFVEEGEKIKVDTRSGEYIERVKS